VVGPTMLVAKKFLKEKNKEVEYNISPNTITKISRFSKYARKSAKARPVYNKLIQELRKRYPDELRIIELSEELKKVLKEDGFDIDKIYRDEIM
jgi:superfamily II RNA helicase